VTSLLAKTVDSLTVETDALGRRAEIDDPSFLDDVEWNPKKGPIEVSGRITHRGNGVAGSPYVAVTLNGEVVATARAFADAWMALVPRGRRLEGRRVLEAYLVEPDRPQLLLRAGHRAPPLGTDLLFGDGSEFDVTYLGFHDPERAGRTRFRWTNGSAAIRVPTDPVRGPTILSVDVLSALKESTRLRILLDRCEVASELTPGGQWSKDIPLGGCAPSGPWTIISFLSETMRPGGRDLRELGVALTRVMLR
jgi:hypothetical protein